MAAGYIAAPGTEVGPCEVPCQHRDCASTRLMAEGLCRYCNQPIGYETGFFADERHRGELVHANCELKAYEEEAR